MNARVLLAVCAAGCSGSKTKDGAVAVAACCDDVQPPAPRPPKPSPSWRNAEMPPLAVTHADPAHPWNDVRAALDAAFHDRCPHDSELGFEPINADPKRYHFKAALDHSPPEDVVGAIDADGHITDLKYFTLDPEQCRPGPPQREPASRELAMPELKYRLIDALGEPSSCEPSSKLEDPDPLELRAIQRRLGANPDPGAVRREAHELHEIGLTPTASGYSFRMSWLARGTIDRHGKIEDAQVHQGPCPHCLPASTRIATVLGPVAVTDIAVGMPVVTFGAHGEREVRPVVATGSLAVGSSHVVVAIELDDGRRVEASPGHPTVDGRTIDQLRVGDHYAGAVVTRVHDVPYTGGRTYDLEVAGDTGTYVADGVPLGSTLR